MESAPDAAYTLVGALDLWPLECGDFAAGRIEEELGFGENGRRREISDADDLVATVHCSAARVRVSPKVLVVMVWTFYGPATHCRLLAGEDGGSRRGGRRLRLPGSARRP